MATDAPKIALIQFPGSTGEWESKRAAEAAGMTCDVFRWNRPPHLLSEYDGYIIGGGMSYQGRVRAGAIAARQPAGSAVFEQVTERGKPIIGISNGAQSMAEAGLVPGLNPGQVEMALAPNAPDPTGRIADFYCVWVYIILACPPDRCLFTADYEPDTVIPIPIAHSEGRFTTRDPEVVQALADNRQIVFQYCDAQGRVEDSRTVNPDGSMKNIAALCNPEGNALAIMPYPERAGFLRQIPEDLPGSWGESKRAAYGDAAAQDASGPGLAIFTAMAAALKARITA